MEILDSEAIVVNFNRVYLFIQKIDFLEVTKKKIKVINLSNVFFVP